MRRHRALFTLAIVGMLSIVVPSYAYAADILLDPATGSFSKDKNFTINVAVAPATGETVNAADGEILFDKGIMSVVSVSKEGAFSLWTSDPTFSNSEGTIKFSGGSPTSFGAQKKILTITFKPVKEGVGKVSFKSGSVLAADGKGTDVYVKGSEASYTVTEPKEAPPPPKEVEAVSTGGGATPLAPIIASPSHPKEDEFYGTSTAEFSWKLSSDITGIRTGISDKEDGTPATLQPATITSIKVPAIKDGDSFFFLQFRNENGWGDMTKRKVRIDTTPPLEFEVTINAGSEGVPAKFAFETKDELSGMGKYEIFLGDTNVASMKALDLTNGVYPIPPQDGGKQKLTVKAYDKAGNVRIFKKEMDIPAVAKPKPKSSEPEAAPVQSGWTIERILAILFAFIIGGLITYNRYANNQAQEEKAIILHHVLKMRDVNDRIFSAMREEFEVMVNNMDAKPQLTPTERDFLENLKEVLEISEGIIDTSIEDLKNVVRGK